MPIRVIDRRATNIPPKEPTPRTRTPQLKQPEPPAIRANEAYRELHGQPARLRGSTAQKIYAVLLEHRDYFRERDREALANSIAIIADSVKESPSSLTTTTIRITVEKAINESRFAIPIDEKPTIITKIVNAATQDLQSPTPATSTTSER